MVGRLCVVGRPRLFFTPPQRLCRRPKVVFGGLPSPTLSPFVLIGFLDFPFSFRQDPSNRLSCVKPFATRCLQ